MKTLKLTLGLITIAAALFTASCKKNDPAAPAQNTIAQATDEYQTADYQALNLDQLENPVVSNGSETAFELSAPADNDPATAAYTQKGNDAIPGVLEKLKLDEKQKAAVKGFFADYKDCIREHVKKVIAIHQDILKKYNDQRQQLLEAYKARKITKQQLEERLKGLQVKLTAELKNHPIRLEELRIARQCRENLLKNIASVLNKDQLDIFHHWLETHK